MVCPVSFDRQETDFAEAECIGVTGCSKDCSHKGIEGPQWQCGMVVEPIIEGSYQPACIAVSVMTSVYGRQLVVRVRQEQVEPGDLLVSEPGEQVFGAVVGVDDRDDSPKDVRASAKPVQRGQRSLAAGSPAGKRTMAVVDLGGSVQAQAYSDSRVSQLTKCGIVEKYSVRLDADIDDGVPAGLRMNLGSDAVSSIRQEGDATQERFAAMQNDRKAFQLGVTDILSDTAGDRIADLRVHYMRLLTPCLVGVLIHVTVVACQVTSTCDLEEEARQTR